MTRCVDARIAGRRSGSRRPAGVLVVEQLSPKSGNVWMLGLPLATLGPTTPSPTLSQGRGRWRGQGLEILRCSDLFSYFAATKVHAIPKRQKATPKTFIIYACEYVNVCVIYIHISRFVFLEFMIRVARLTLRPPSLRLPSRRQRSHNSRTLDRGFGASDSRCCRFCFHLRPMRKLLVPSITFPPPPP